MDLPAALLGPHVGVILFALALGLMVGWLLIDSQFRSHAQAGEHWAERARMHMAAYRKLLLVEGDDEPLRRRLMRREYLAALDCGRRATQFREQIPAYLRRLYLH